MARWHRGGTLDLLPENESKRRTLTNKRKHANAAPLSFAIDDDVSAPADTLSNVETLLWHPRRTVRKLYEIKKLLRAEIEPETSGQ